MWGRLEPAWDFSPAGETRMNAAAGGLKPRRRLKPAEACPTWTGGPTLARKCEVIPAPALRCRPLIVAIGTAGETACPTLLDQSFGEVGGAGGFACRWKLISIAHPNPENGYAPCTPCRGRRPAKRSTDPERSAAGLALAVSRWPGREFALTSTRS